MGRWFHHWLLVSTIVLGLTLYSDIEPGTFGGDDFMHSLLGEASDHIVRIGHHSQVYYSHAH